MPELSVEIADYVEAVCPPVTLTEIQGRFTESLSVGITAKRRRPALLVAATSVAALVAVGALLFQAVPEGSPPMSAAAVTLTEAARVAASQHARPLPGRGQYLYYQVTESVLSLSPVRAGNRPFIFQSVETIQTWVAPNGSGRQRISTTKNFLLLASQRQAWVAAGSPKFGPAVGITDTVFPTLNSGTPPVGGPLIFPAGNKWYLSYPQTSKFPTQTAALERAIKKYYGVTGGASTVYLLAGDVLQVGATPSLRAALFTLVKQLPGVTLVGQTKDDLGRQGVGVEIGGVVDNVEVSPGKVAVAGGNRTVLIFDPKTSAVLGYETIVPRATSYGGTIVPKDTLVGFKTFGSTGISSSIDRLPNGSLVTMTPPARNPSS
jgi:hypothetical protein